MTTTIDIEIKKITAGNIRYISGGRKAELERFTIPIKFVTAERNAVPNAARKYTVAVSVYRGTALQSVISSLKNISIFG